MVAPVLPVSLPADVSVDADGEQVYVSAAGRWFIGPHAVARYIERHRPGVPYETALEELIRWSEIAVIKRRLRSGAIEAHADVPMLKMRFILATGTGPLPALVTVLAPIVRVPGSTTSRERRRLRRKAAR